MDERERALKDIEKLEKAVERLGKLELAEKYTKPYEWAKNYLHDAKHYFEKGNYFSAFGCANYAYGIIDAILIYEGKKEDEV